MVISFSVGSSTCNEIFIYSEFVKRLWAAQVEKGAIYMYILVLLFIWFSFPLAYRVYLSVENCIAESVGFALFACFHEFLFISTWIWLNRFDKKCRNPLLRQSHNQWDMVLRARWSFVLQENRTSEVQKSIETRIQWHIRTSGLDGPCNNITIWYHQQLDGYFDDELQYIMQTAAVAPCSSTCCASLKCSCV